MPLIYGIDPGTSKTAVVCWTGSRITAAQIIANEHLLLSVRENMQPNAKVACEMINAMGMAVGASVFETVLFIGQLKEAVKHRGGSFELIYRRDVKLHMCGQARAKDANIRQALLDRFGEKGTKDNPGVTRGLHSHLWQAFAVAVTAHDKLNGR